MQMICAKVLCRVGQKTKLLQNQDGYADIDNLIYEIKKHHLDIYFLYIYIYI